LFLSDNLPIFCGLASCLKKRKKKKENKENKQTNKQTNKKTKKEARFYHQALHIYASIVINVRE
jgi:hypothetical protein